MLKEGKLTSLLFLVFAVLLILNSIDNPRLTALRGPDIIRLIAIGLLFGVAIGVQVGARVGRKVSQP